jgi:hypothetical protein
MKRAFGQYLLEKKQIDLSYQRTTSSGLLPIDFAPLAIVYLKAPLQLFSFA